jgi:hypothetical protein
LSESLPKLADPRVVGNFNPDQAARKHYEAQGIVPGYAGQLFIPLTSYTTGIDGIRYYPIPDHLQRHRVRYRLQAGEYGRTGHHCTVVTGLEGERLSPYYRAIKVSDTDWHSTCLFGERNLGLVSVRWNTSGFELSIRHWRLISSDVTVFVEVMPVLSIHGQLQAGEILPANPGMPPEFNTWNPAVEALFERLNCSGCSEVHFAK